MKFTGAVLVLALAAAASVQQTGAARPSPGGAATVAAAAATPAPSWLRRLLGEAAAAAASQRVVIGGGVGGGGFRSGGGWGGGCYGGTGVGCNTGITQTLGMLNSQDAVRQAVDFGGSPYSTWGATQSAQRSAIAGAWGNLGYLANQQVFDQGGVFWGRRR